jgi:hypothetical protein
LLHDDSMQLMKRKKKKKKQQQNSYLQKEEIVCDDVKDANVLIACYWKLQLQCKLKEQKKPENYYFNASLNNQKNPGKKM